MLTRRKQQRGNALVIAILATALFFGCAQIALLFHQARTLTQQYAADANSALQVREALQDYADANKAAFRTGRTLLNVHNQMTPTTAELQNLGFLAATGPNLTPFGSSFATVLQLQPNTSITGMVYLAGNVTNGAGIPDPQKACGIAHALGDIGVCAPPNNAATLGNSQVQLANPSGQAASFGALIYVAP
jgi:hypothetical protein